MFNFALFMKKFYTNIKLTIFLLLIILIQSCDPNELPWNKTEKVEEDSRYYIVSWVSDGDTFWVKDENGNKEKIRLIGIDAPESVNYGNKLKEEFGKESHHFLDSLIKGRKVKLTFDIVKYDKYGRTLAYAFLQDGTFINKKILSHGYATVFNYAPNLRYARTFVLAEDSAVSNDLGLWKRR